MNEGCPLNNGEKHNNYSLVRRPSIAVEKPAPGAKRILSGMVADTLGLVKKARPPRIVTVDDEPWLLKLYEALVRICFENAMVLSYDDGDKAWQELSATDPDLLITDMCRPGLNGWKMLPMLAAKRVRFPIIVTSGNAEEKGVRQCAGSELTVSFLVKPFLLMAFHRELLKHLANNVAESHGQYNLGMCYLYGGRGITKDIVESYRWLRLAADRGHKDASEALSLMQALLSPEQFQEGERRYREY